MIVNKGSVAPGESSELSERAREAADWVGEAVRQIVADQADDLGDKDRAAFMLTGLDPAFLEGVSRKLSNGVLGSKTLKLAINKEVARDLDISEDFLTEESAVYWRHYAGADIVVFAPSDNERDGIGAGLRSISRIDGDVIMQSIDEWVHRSGEISDRNRNYLRNALRGLRQSGVCTDLGMWVTFIQALLEAKNADPLSMLSQQIQNAAHALQIPIHGLSKLPRMPKDDGSIPGAKVFERAFLDAREQSGAYVMLTTPKQEPVNLPDVYETLDDWRGKGDSQESKLEIENAIAVTEKLLQDSDQIRPGEWRASQEEFCRQVSWSDYGHAFFKYKIRTKAPKIGYRTLDYLSGDYGDMLTDTDKSLLERLDQSVDSVDSEEKADFFDRWRDHLSRTEAGSLSADWAKQVFRKEETHYELLSLLLQGVRILVEQIAGNVERSEDYCVLVRALQNKASSWEALDSAVHKLFCFEVRSIMEMLGGQVVWDIHQCFEVESRGRSYNSERRKVPLEMYLLPVSEVGKIRHNGHAESLKSAPKVRAIWQPCHPSKVDSIQLALPEDLENLTRLLSNTESQIPTAGIASRTHDDSGNDVQANLWDSASFTDAFQEANGITVNSVDPIPKEEDWLLTTKSLIKNIKSKDEGIANKIGLIEDALWVFEDVYTKAIEGIVTDQKTGFFSNAIERQAKAYSKLCERARSVRGRSSLGHAIAEKVASFGLISSKDRGLVLLAAWHPLRLLERKQRSQYLSNFIREVLCESLGCQNLEVAFDEMHRELAQWRSPEAAVLDGVTYLVSDSIGGYSLMEAAEFRSGRMSDIEQTAPEAAAQMGKAVQEYASIHPHKKGGLSITLDHVISTALPRHLIQTLESQKRHPDLCCILRLVHDNPVERERLYKSLNERLNVKGTSQAPETFWSKLRVSVGEHQDVLDGEPNADMVGLHEAVSACATPQWIGRSGETSDQELNDVPSIQARPRFWVGDDGSDESGAYLTQPDPGATLGRYYDLLYSIAKEATLPADEHGVLVHRLSLLDEKAKRIVDRAHDQGQWVISFDKMLSRQLLSKRGIQVIRDMSIPLSDSRFIVSARGVGPLLKRRVTEVLTELLPTKASTVVESICELLLGHIEAVSGQKILSASSNANAAKEMVGLCVGKMLVGSVLTERSPGPIWISLDDYRHWFHRSNSEIADFLAITVRKQNDRFEMDIQVGEAKYVGSSSLSEEAKKSLRQTQDTCRRLKSLLVDNEDPLSFQAWCRRLSHLLVAREGLSSCLRSDGDRTEFFKAMAQGKVAIRISGESVVCVSEGSEEDIVVLPGTDELYIRQTRIPAGSVRKILLNLDSGGAIEIDRPVWCERRRLESLTSRPPKKGVGPEVVELPEESNSLHYPEGQLSDDFAKQSIIPSSGNTPLFNEFSEKQSVDHFNGSKEPERAPSGNIPRKIWKAINRIRSKEDDQKVTKETEEWSEAMCYRLQKALGHFNMHAAFSTAEKGRLTPNSLLVTFMGHPSLTRKGIEKRLDELLTTHGIHVQDVRAGVGTITLAVQRQKRAVVNLASTWLQADWPDTPGEMTNFLIGVREDSGEPLFMNLEGKHAGYEVHAPHTLIAGETKSGKGVLTQSLLLQIVAFNDPKSAELIVIDPKKGVDFGWISNMPHLRGEVITDPEGAQTAFQSLVEEMDARYDRLSEQKTANLTDYNRLVEPKDRMPRIYLIHDEIGAWMAQEKEYQNTVLGCVSHLGMKARAAGIHMIIITQRADVDAVPGRLRDNLGNRLCLKVQNGTGSKMILNQVGAENLLGQGHLAATFTGESPPPGEGFFTLQVPFAPNPDLAEIAEAARDHWNEQSSSE